MGKAEKLECMSGDRDTRSKYASKAFVDSLLRCPWVMEYRQLVLICEEHAHEELGVGFVLPQYTIGDDPVRAA